MTCTVRLTTMPDATPRPGQAAPDSLIAGDILLLKPGFEGGWTTPETVRKIDVFAS